MAQPPDFTLEALHKGLILPVNKPAGWTSFDVVNKLRMVSRVKKVGHAGTLDPFATGLLLICFGKATRQSAELMELEKEYTGIIELGRETDTHDITGRVIRESVVPELEAADIERAMQRYRGPIDQVPPMYSALKRGGRRLYELARQGVEVERAPRRVVIYRFDLLDYHPPELHFRMVCSRGTYVRAVARDLGRDLGCGAYLKTLIRTRIGDYTLDQAWELSALVQEIKRQKQQRHDHIS